MNSTTTPNGSRAPVAFEPPGGGFWELETVHTIGAVPVAFQELFPDAMRSGFTTVCRRYGLPLSHIEAAFVGDHCYCRAVPVGAPPPKPGKESSAPPAAVLKVMSRLHPEMRRRRRAAGVALRDRLWEEDRATWEREVKPARFAANRALQSVDLASLDGAALADHLDACLANAAAGTIEHFELLGAYNVPVGRFVAACRGWGIADGTSLDLLGGSSPASSVLPALRRAAETGDLTDLLAEHGWRILDDYTPRGRTLSELPELLELAVARAGVAVDPPPAAVAAVRDAVPEADRARFDALLADACAGAGVRDDNVGPCFMWSLGLLRRALLEVGRRLVDAGIAAAPDDTMWLATATLDRWLRDGDGLDGASISARVAEVAAVESAGVPASLGWSEGGPPDPSVFGADVAELTTAFMAVLDLELPQMSLGSVAGDRGFAGVGVGSEPYTGRAVVARTVADAAMLLEPGDVLVTLLTTPAYNAILPVCGAVVTEQGGLLSHTALVAREIGLPAVCGVAGICDAIPHGAEIEVDPVAGTVRVVAQPALAV